METKEDDDIQLWDREEMDLLEIPLPRRRTLRLRQFGSSENRWGIHSCVWDGGIGTLAYLMQTQQDKSTLVVDVGAGTGIVGLGIVAAGYCGKAILTDLTEALALLEENKRMNHSDNSDVVVMELSWGNKSLPDLLIKLLLSANQVLVVGADVIYRQHLIEPLLTTLRLLLQFLQTKCIIGNQSTRIHLDEFYAKARSAGFVVNPRANVTVPPGALDPSACRVVLDSFFQKAKGIVNICELSLNASVAS